MTPEARLDRLERIAMLLATAGYRARRVLRSRVREHDEKGREHDEKIDHLVDLQIKNEERFARNEERLAKFSEKTDQRFRELAESQARTDRNLAELIKIIREGRNGDAVANS